MILIFLVLVFGILLGVAGTVITFAYWVASKVPPR